MHNRSRKLWRISGIVCLVLTLFPLPGNTKAQHSRRCCGVITYDQPRLTPGEAETLNTHLNNQRKDFDFARKKIAFANGRAGTHLIRKYEYMCETCRDKIYPEGMQFDQVVVFDATQKAASGGYDAVVITNAYRVADQNTVRKLIRKLGRRKH